MSRAEFVSQQHRQLSKTGPRIHWNDYLSPEVAKCFGFHSLQMSAIDEKRKEALVNKNSDGVIQLLRDALENKFTIHEPWTSGVLTLPEYETTLFYKRKDDTST